MSKQRFAKDVNIKNRQASYEYELLDKYVAGIVLTGTEIKSIREGKINLQDGFGYFNNGELYVKGINISPYAQGTHYNHEATCERKLLLKKSELKKLQARTEEKGLTLVPTRLFIAIAGGVSANSGLRKGLQLLAQKRDWDIFIPAFEYCTDNAAMIAMAAHFKYLKNEFTTMDVIPLARMPV